MDRSVRQWCEENFVMYQPYASLRNLAAIKPPVSTALKRLASAHQVSEHAIVLKFFIQTDAIVIPRASSSAHLKANLQVMTLNFDLTPAEMQSLGWSA